MTSQPLPKGLPGPSLNVFEKLRRPRIGWAALEGSGGMMAPLGPGRQSWVRVSSITHRAWKRSPSQCRESKRWSQHNKHKTKIGGGDTPPSQETCGPGVRVGTRNQWRDFSHPPPSELQQKTKRKIFQPLKSELEANRKKLCWHL